MQTVHVVPKYQIDTPQITIHDTEAPDFSARLSIALVEKWGMVAGAEAGEDSQGRAKLRLMAPSEVVDRACSTAELLVGELRKRGWLTAVPSWDEARKLAKEAKFASDAEETEDRVRRAADRAERTPK